MDREKGDVGLGFFADKKKYPTSVTSVLCPGGGTRTPDLLYPKQVA